MKNLIIISIAFLLAACSSQQKAVNTGTTNIPDSKETAFRKVFIDAKKAMILEEYERAEELFLQCHNADPKNAAVNYELARLFMKKPDPPRALNHADKAYSLDPTNKWYRGLYADLLMRAGKGDEALVIFEQWVKDEPNNIDAHYQLKDQYIKNGEPEKAIAMIETILSKWGDREELLVEAYSIYRTIGNAGKAVETLQRLIELAPDNPQHQGELALFYLDLGQEDKALAQLEEFLKADPENAEAKFILAELKRAKGDMETYYGLMTEAFGSEELSIDRMVGVLIQFVDSVGKNLESGRKGIELARLSTTTHSKDPKSWSVYGDLLYYDNQYKPAREAYLQALDLDANRILLWQHLFFCDNQLQDYKALKEHTEDALEYFPNNASIYLFNGLAKNQLKEYREAITILKQGSMLAANADPQLRSDIFSLLGDSYHALEEHELSDKAYEDCLELNPDNAVVLNNYAYYLSLRGENMEKAETMAARANKLNPNNRSFQDTYGWVLFKLARYQQALEWIEKAYNNGGQNDPEILEHLGDAYYKTGNTGRALELWKEALDNGSKSEILQRKVRDGKYYEI